MSRRVVTLAVFALAAFAFLALPASVALGATVAPTSQARSCPSDEWCDLYFATEPSPCVVCAYPLAEDSWWDQTTSRLIDVCDCSISQVWEPVYEWVSSNIDTIVNFFENF